MSTTPAPSITTQPPATGRLPDFVLIGAMKSGTTTLNQYLQRHPDVFMCKPKEPAFFSRDDVYERGLDWYRDLFASARPAQRCGEASTCYTRSVSHPHAAERLAEHLPGAKLIYIMRHPVERSYSHYVHAMTRRFVRTGRAPISLREALDTMPSIVQTSRYIDEIRRYESLFPREQLLLLALDDLQDAPERALAELQRFLEVPARDLLADGPLVANQAASPVMHRYATSRLERWRRGPLGRALAALTPRAARDGIRRWLVRKLQYSNSAEQRKREFKAAVEPLSDDHRALLHTKLDDATRELEEYWQRDLSHWRAQ